jgi:hypothetical protein
MAVCQAQNCRLKKKKKAWLLGGFNVILLAPMVADETPDSSLIVHS